jgi:capsule polysaccharide export protein KpsC/LpsZ
VEPELALLTNAPFVRDQFALIVNIAQSLPADMRLYVKEHPVMLSRGRRPLSYYREMSAVPNVRLVDADMHTLLSNAEAVVTITGTAGLEALLLGKPVVTLGNVFYNDAEGLIEHTTDVTALPSILKRVAAQRRNEEQMIHYITALLDESIELNLPLMMKTLNEKNAQGCELVSRYANDILRVVQTKGDGSSDTTSVSS